MLVEGDLSLNIHSQLSKIPRIHNETYLIQKSGMVFARAIITCRLIPVVDTLFGSYPVLNVEPFLRHNAQLSRDGPICKIAKQFNVAYNNWVRHRIAIPLNLEILGQNMLVFKIDEFRPEISVQRRLLLSDSSCMSRNA
jgi:hypothetical protein